MTWGIYWRSVGQNVCSVLQGLSLRQMDVLNVDHWLAVWPMSGAKSCYRIMAPEAFSKGLTWI